MEREPAAEREFRYDAFISYRHVQPDRKWAKWLHRSLETFRTPKALVAEGAPARLDKVFRDELELSASSDLAKEIDEALEQSRYLIVVCSPRTPESKWVNQEIVRFREMERADQVLALLLEGEPAEAFPPALLKVRHSVSDERGWKRQELERVEPLAADVRTPHPEGGRYRRRMALLRLLAPVLGCDLDDLNQRDRQRGRRRAAALSIAAVVLIGILTGLTLWALDSKRVAQKELRQAVAHQLAAQSVSVLEEAPQLGVLLAAEAALTHLRVGELTTVASRQALWDALSRVGGAGLEPHAGPVRTVDLAPDGGILVTAADDGIARIWKLGNGVDSPQYIGVQIHVDVPDPMMVAPDTRFWIYTARLSPDGRWLFTSSYDGSAWLWELDSDSDEMRPIQLIAPDSDSILSSWVTDVTFTLDGRWLFASSTDDPIRRWQIGEDMSNTDGEPIPIKGWTTDLAVSPDGAWLAAGGRSGDVSLVDLRSDSLPSEPVRLTNLGDEVLGVHFDASGKLLAAATNGTVHLWELGVPQTASGALRRIAVAPTLAATAMDPSGRWFAAGTQNGAVWIWDLQVTASAGPALMYDAHSDAVTALEFSPDGRWLASGSIDGTARVWKISAVDGVMDRPWLLQGHQEQIASIDFDSEGSLLATGSYDGTVRVWDLARQRGRTGYVDVQEHGSAISDVTFDASGRWLVAANVLEGLARLSDLDRRETRVIGLASSGERTDALAVALDPEALVIAVPKDDGSGTRLRVWRLNAQGLADTAQIVVANEGTLSTIAIRYPWLAATSGWDAVYAWNLQSPDSTPLRFADENVFQVIGLGIGPTRARLVARLASGGSRVWDLEGGDAPFSLSGHDRRGVVLALAMGPNDRWVATSGTEGSIRLWDLDRDVGSQESIVLTVPGLPWIRNLLITQDGQRLASAGDDGAVHVWTLPPRGVGRGPITLGVHQGEVTAMSATPDGKWLATGDRDGVVQLWELEVARLFATLAGNQGGVSTMAFHPDGGTLAVGSGAGFVRLWPVLDIDQLLAAACRTAGRNLTPTEWRTFLPGNYKKTCSNMPTPPELRAAAWTRD